MTFKIITYLDQKLNLGFFFQIEKVIDSAIEEAKEIFESQDTIEVEEEETSTEIIPEEQIDIDANSDEAFNDISNETDEQEEETTETSEPSKDIDLGSVQEVQK